MSFLWYWPAGGWNFDQWKAAQTWEAVHSQQSGNPAPLKLISESETLAGWEREAKYWRGISDQILGTLTDVPPKTPVVEWLGDELVKTSQPGYSLRRLRYQLTSDEWGYAWLLTPAGSEGKRMPAVIALHQTQPAGKHEVVGLEYRPEGAHLGYGRELVERGFIVFAPDAIAFGERMAEQASAKYHSAAEFFAAQPAGSVMGKMAYDTSRAVDVLQSLPGVDGDRIGCIGHSHGGYGTLFAMVQDPRIKAGVISCGLSMLRSDPIPQRWWRMTSLMPRLGYWDGKLAQTPIDFHQWVALIAPRPLYISVATKDGIFPNADAVGPAMELTRSVYKLYGAAADLQVRLYDGPHSFPQESRDGGYVLLSKTLGR